jgi:hypothetical protein
MLRIASYADAISLLMLVSEVPIGTMLISAFTVDTLFIHLISAGLLINILFYLCDFSDSNRGLTLLNQKISTHNQLAFRGSTSLIV